MTASSLSLMANAIRALAIDAVERANSGHPGAPMGMADMAAALWTRHLKHNPSNPNWFNRDRFVLSNGHASALLYAVLHLTGYELSIEDIKNFRQIHSKTPGHPELGITPGIETTTGPLGQGLGNAVGMALSEKLLANEFNRPGYTVIDHNTYVFLGDGCLMEGISHEVAALAGAWKLNKLVALYDDNGISIDGKVEPWFPEDTAARFAAYGWNVLGPIDGHDGELVAETIRCARRSNTQPTLIICKTQIGKYSPNRANTPKVHGEPLGAEEIQLTRDAMEWTDKPFHIPADVYAAWNARDKGHTAESLWDAQFASYEAIYPDLGAELYRRMRGDLPNAFGKLAHEAIEKSCNRADSVASRRASQLALEEFTAKLPEMLGGSADLTSSNLTNTKSTSSLRFKTDGQVEACSNGKGVEVPGRHINYGVREFGMASIMNGIALHGGHIPYGGTFLTFSDYSRNALRMAALMKLRVIHVFTHDSIGLGEDGPTHQPVEHAASLRLIPNLDVWRPADTVEATVAWAVALQNKSQPTALLLSRQSLKFQPKTETDDVCKGGYVLKDPPETGVGRPLEAVLIATGSEVQLALRAQVLLADAGILTRVVSMPSTTTFDKQSSHYKSLVLPSRLPRIAVEMGVSHGWWKYGCSAVVAIDTYGESAPAEVLFNHFGFTPQGVASVVREVISKPQLSQLAPLTS
ncbi:transketolase [Polaromonas sp. JS666]|uniref:transketolase n=1 Tax=Polaromonas sp. (strain JS666 / ATCC BAA-500) TaxID=296591 RepID=UPI0000532FB2|nr:transketolase [Polaromonas sp. JS666]ABE46238.1 transketolase [Polaromonas sp. JS666]